MLENQISQSDQQSQNQQNSVSNMILSNDSEHIQEISIEKLNNSKNKLALFIQRNSEAVHLPIPRNIVQYLNVTKEKSLAQNTLSPQSITRYAKTRINKMIKNKKIKRNWSVDDVRMLIWVTSAYCNVHDIRHTNLVQKDWQEISSMIPGSDGESVMFKWLGLRKNNLSMQQWKEQQKILLKSIIQNIGSDKWSQIAKNLYKQSTWPNKIYRGPKQCREHWNCYLNPALKKGPWDKQEDQLLMKLVHDAQGNKKWASFVKYFGGRTQNALKNRFYLLLERQRKNEENANQFQSEMQFVEKFLQRNREKKDQRSHLQKEIMRFLDSNNESESPVIQKTVKKRGSKKKDEDWLTSFKNSHYTSYKKLQKSVNNNPKTPLRKRQQHKNNLQHTHHKNTQKQSLIKDSANILRNFLNPQKQRDSELLLPKMEGACFQDEFQMEKSVYGDMDENKYEKKKKLLKVENLSENQESIMLENINVIEITKQKLSQINMKTFNYIPCQLKQDRLKFIKYPLPSPKNLQQESNQPKNKQ